MLVQSDNVHALEEDMGASTAQRTYHRQSRLELERPGLEILQENFSVEAVDEPDISLAMAAPSADSLWFLEMEAQLRRQGARRFHTVAITQSQAGRYPGSKSRQRIVPAALQKSSSTAVPCGSPGS
jgi:hypothetical protein